jgi:hypothetical protein
MHKVIIVKAKQFPHNTNNGWFNAYPWTKVKRELQYYTEKACCNFVNTQTMYGILAVGDMVYLYAMKLQKQP